MARFCRGDGVVKNLFRLRAQLFDSLPLGPVEGAALFGGDLFNLAGVLGDDDMPSLVSFVKCRFEVKVHLHDVTVRAFQVDCNLPIAAEYRPVEAVLDAHDLELPLNEIEGVVHLREPVENE
jgi:hypothetical protein